MWREGFSVELVAWMLNLLALMFGAALGARALIDPNWAARLVRLKPDDQPGGFAEFRATFGGVFLGVHAAALLFSVGWILDGEALAGLYAGGAALTAAAGWGGAAVGRLLSMWRDGTRTRFNAISAATEAALAAVIAGPWLVWFFETPS